MEQLPTRTPLRPHEKVKIEEFIEHNRKHFPGPKKNTMAAFEFVPIDGEEHEIIIKSDGFKTVVTARRNIEDI